MVGKMDEMKTEKSKLILVVTNIPNPYRIPLFNELKKQLDAEGMKLKVVFAAKGYARRMFNLDMNECKFDYQILDATTYTAASNVEKTYFSYKGLISVVKKDNPYRTIIIGYSAGTMMLWLRSFIKPTPFIIWSGTIQKEGRNDSWWRVLQRKIITKRAKAFVAYGKKAVAYLKTIGAPENKISTAINTVDTDFFRSQTEKERTQLQPQVKKHLTYIGYLVPRKNVIRLLDVVKDLSATRNDFVLDLIGDGESKAELESYSQQHNLQNFVQFHGFKQKSELPAFLAKSTAFLFQTDFDIWGLTLNEAMASGVPCLSSINAGASYDLIQEGETGFVVDFSDKVVVKDKINWLLDHPEEAKSMGIKASNFIMDKASLKVSTQGFIKAIALSE